MNAAVLLLSIFSALGGMIALSQAQPSPYSLQIILTLNNTDNTLFIPGKGELISKDFPETEYFSLPHFFLASYSNNNVKALFFSQETPQSIKIKGNQTHHIITLNQSLSNSQAFLAFTKGDYRTIDSRKSLIKEGGFLSHISPSFSTGLGTKNPITLLLSYTDIDIRGSFTFRSGVHQMTIESNRTADGQKVLLLNETIG